MRRRTTPRILGSDNRFVISVKTDNLGTSSDLQFTIPTQGGVSYNYTINTSDGQNITGVTGNRTITFPSAGTYDIRIRGSFPKLFFADLGDKLKLLDIKNWGIYGIGSTEQSQSFQGCANMVISASDFGNFENVTSFNLAWAGCSSLSYFPLLNVGNATNFAGTWFNCSGLTTFPELNVSNGTNFNQSWRGCTNIISFPLLDTSNGTDFTSAWRGCTSLANFPENAFDTNITGQYTDAFISTNLTQPSIDGILKSLDLSGVSNGNVRQNGGASPSMLTGQPLIDSLRAKGWIVTVTGGY